MNTFEHWNFDYIIPIDIEKCFKLLKTFDLDLESKDFIGDIGNDESMSL